MKLFISYAAARRDAAEPLCHALEADGHEVFLDRSDLEPGRAYHDRLREAIAACDQFIFLVSPESVRPGSYALTELGLAQERWPRPSGHVLPVMAAPTPFAELPPYLAAVTVLQPKGNLAAEVAAHYAKQSRSRCRPILLGAASLLGALILAAGGLWWRQAEQRAEQEAARRAALAQLTQATQAAARLCQAGSFAPAWKNFDQLLARPEAAAVVEAAQADCAMLWLRKLSRSGQEGFAGTVDTLLPVLGRELARADAQRQGDLHAHIGWGEYLRWRDGRTADPLAHYERAIAADPANPYGNAMWAHYLATRDGSAAEVDRLFDAALASGRATPFVRQMQIAVALNHGDRLPLGLRAANQARQRGEPLPAGAAGLYRRWCESGLRHASDRARLLPVLGTEDALATLAWLQPVDSLPPERQPLWRLCEATLLAHGGRREQAERSLNDLLARLGPGHAGGSYERWAKEQLQALRRN
jgi:hypothetical protein